MSENEITNEGLQRALSAAVAAYSGNNPRSRQLAKDAALVMPGGNTRTTLWNDPFPLFIQQGQGAKILDADGHWYVDFLGEFTQGIFGHSPEELKHAITDALERGLNLSSHNAYEGQLAEQICGRFPSIDRVRFTNSGTEANLMAITAAKAFTGRDLIIVFEGAYHGTGLAFASGVTAETIPHHFLVLPYNDKQALLAAVEAHGAELAAIIAEPMLGAGGCMPGDADFLRCAQRLARSAKALLIFDEVQTARLSPGGRQTLLGLSPDLTTLGKFFGGGLAFGCFGGRADIMALFDPREPGHLTHAGTFNNNSLTMAAGLAACKSLLTADALAALNARGDYLREQIAETIKRYGAPFRVTGLGSIMNIHPLGSSGDVPAWRQLLFFEMAQAGIFFAMRGLIALSFAVADTDIARFLEALEAFLARSAPLFAASQTFERAG